MCVCEIMKEQNIFKIEGLGYSLVVEPLPSIYKTLGFISTAPCQKKEIRKKKEKNVQLKVCI